MDNLEPINGYVLVELADKYKYASTPEVQYATKTSGVVRRIPSVDKKDMKFMSVNLKYYEQLLNKRVWFKSYEDDVKLGEDDRYTFIKFDDIKGYENV